MPTWFEYEAEADRIDEEQDRIRTFICLSCGRHKEGTEHTAIMICPGCMESMVEIKKEGRDGR